MPITLSLRRKLILATVGAGLVPLLLGLAIAYWSARETLRVTIGDHFQELAKSTARHVDLIVEREVLEANNLALEPLVRSAVIEANEAYAGLDDDRVQALLAAWATQAKTQGLENAPATNQALSQRLQAYQGLGGEYYQIMLTDVHGVPLAAIRSPQIYVQSDMAWWKQAMRGNLYIGDTGRSTEGESVLVLAVPIRNSDGASIGVLQMTHYMEDLFHPISDLRVGQTGHANLIDSSGTIIVEPVGPPSQHLQINTSLLNTITSTHLGWAISQGEHRGTTVIVAYAPVEVSTMASKDFGHKQWYVFIRQDTREAFASTNDLLTRGFMLGLLLVLLLSLFGTLLARGISKPLQQLHIWAQEVGKGNLDQRLNLRTGDEIQDLAETFNDMARQLQSLYHSLEEKVAERTRELATLNEELQRKEALRGHLLQRAITAQEEERKRVARELHDGFAQTLTALIMSLETAESVIPAELTAVRRHLTRTKALTSQTLQETRQLIVELRPTVLDDLGLVPALRWYVGWLLETRAIHSQLTVEGNQRRLQPEIETVLFRIAQESLSNIAKHAKATEAVVALRYAPQHVTLQVSDNGIGFDPSVVLNPDEPTRSLGLMGIQERISLAGGTLDVVSRQGQGTQIIATIPV